MAQKPTEKLQLLNDSVPLSRRVQYANKPGCLISKRLSVMEAGRENKARAGAPGAFETEWPSNDVSTSGGIFPHTTFYDADKKAMTSISATHHFARMCNCDGRVRQKFA